MAEVVAQKFWVKISSKEIEAIVRAIVPDEMCDFDLIEVQTTIKDHKVDTVTLGLSYNTPVKTKNITAFGACPECGSPDPNEIHSGDCSYGKPVDDE